MKIQVLSLATALAAFMAPVTANAALYFEFKVSAFGTGFVYPYCTQAQGPACAVPKPISGEIETPTFGEYIEEGLNTFSLGRYNASGEYRFTIERRGTQLYGRDVSFAYSPCSAGLCDTTMLTASSSTISVSRGVPEPATWLMMILGFAAIGYSMRRATVLRHV